jgi:hypothetical protein
VARFGWRSVGIRFTKKILRAHAEKLGIHLLFIPLELTDELQPPDRFVFGATQGIYRRLYALHCRSDPFCPTDKKLAAAVLIREWVCVSTHVLEEPWSVYGPALDNEQWTTKKS